MNSDLYHYPVMLKGGGKELPTLLHSTPADVHILYVYILSVHARV